MKKQISIGLGVLVGLSASAQGSFEKYYAIGFGSRNLNLHELSSGNIFAAVAWPSGTSLLDQQGNLILSRSYAIDTMVFFQSVKRVSDNAYYFGTYYAQGVNAPDPGPHPLLGRMDSLGNISILHYYHLNVGASIGNGIGDLEVISQKSLIGWDRDNRLFLMKADSNLTHVWSRVFAQEGVFHFIKEFPSGDLLAGFDLTAGGAALMRMDADGNILWCKSYFRPDGGMHDAVIESDSSFVVVGYSSNPGQKAFLMNVNGNGDVLWSRGYNTVQPWNTLLPRVRVVETLDDKYVLLLLQDRPWLLKTDLNGDTLWVRRFGVNGVSYSTADLLATEDGGYMFDGEGYPWGTYIFKTDSLGHVPCSEDPPTALYITQLFPVDSNVTLTSVDGAVTYPAYALDTTYAPLTVIEGCTITSVPGEQYGSELRIYPNPTSGRITVQFADPLRAESHYSVYDTMGRLLSQGPLPGGKQAVELDLSRYGTGTYLITVTGRDGVYRERVVVE